MSSKGPWSEFRSRQELDLDRFAEEFKDEAHLRNAIADLLVKAGATGVRITHAPNERGKDIIFYRDDGLSRNVLFACVIKNDRITGRADSNSGAATVLNQATQALLEPYISRTTGLRNECELYMSCHLKNALPRRLRASDSNYANAADRLSSFVAWISLINFSGTGRISSVSNLPFKRDI
jgi:hypothetical protein